MSVNCMPPVVVLEPRTQACAMDATWDAESSVLSLSIRCPRQANPKTLADDIDYLLHIEANDYRVMLGDLDVLLDSEQRIVSLEIRTNPDHWLPEPLVPVALGEEQNFLRLPLDFDENNIASYDVPVAILRDPARKEIRFRLGDYVASKWALLADGFAVGLTLDDHLCEFCLFGENLPSTDAG